MATGPLTFRAGVKLSVPSALTLTLPSAGSTLAAVTDSVVPASTSVSLASTSIDDSATLIEVEARSATATGASLVPATVTVMLVVVPSSTPTVKTSVRLSPCASACTAALPFASV